MNNSYRIIDANLNRAAEGLRVLEDHFRFVSTDKLINEDIRDLRHRVRKTLKHLDKILISSRESSNDNGLEISQKAGNDIKSSEKEFIAANFKRVQEALRSIEENLNLTGNYGEAKTFERIRFDVYTLERTALGVIKKKLPEGIYCITAEEFSKGRKNVEVVKEMLESGIKIIQYREKEDSKPRKQMISECREIRKLTRKHEALFIVNDFLDIAILCEADGIHCGQDDLSVQDVKKLAQNLIVGISTHSPEQALQAVKDGADYIGVGPVFSTKTKKNVCDAVGLEYLEFAVKNINIPFVAIGGIKENNLDEVIKRGVKNISLVTEIVGAENIREKIKSLNNKLKDIK
jgi:thiamine-phosphate pyrophosphorylase